MPVKPMLAKICEGLEEAVEQLKGAPFLGKRNHLSPPCLHLVGVCMPAQSLQDCYGFGGILTLLCEFTDPVVRYCLFLQPSSSTMV